MRITREPGSVAPRLDSVFTRAIVHEIEKFDDLLRFLRSEQAEHPDVTVFVTLDDVAQAFYTSMHATESDELEIDTDDLDFLGDPGADRIRQRRQFAHTLAQLARDDLRVRWADLRDSRPSSAEQIDVLAAVNESPADILDDAILVMHVPTDDTSAAIAALPNGYFSDDWNVFENHAVARRLALDFGYHPLGVGASWVGFVREAPLSADLADRLVVDLGDLYGEPDAPGWARLADAVTRSSTLFLGYTDNFAD